MFAAARATVTVSLFQQFVTKRGWEKELVVHWPPGGGLAQCGHLLHRRKLPAAGHRTLGLHARRSYPTSRNEAGRPSRSAPRQLEARLVSNR